MNLSKLTEIEREIYWLCYEKPVNVKEIYVKLVEKDKRISISYIRQICGILVVMKLVTKIRTRAGNILYHSIELEKKENESR